MRVSANEFLRSLRIAKEMTQQQVGEATGIDGEYISRMESEGHPIGAKSAHTLSKFFGVDRDKLYAPKPKAAGMRTGARSSSTAPSK